MAKKIIIGCRLPNGIVIEHPTDPNNKVLLAGANRSLVIGGDHSTTEVDAEYWATWKAANPTFPPLTSGAIFEASSVADAVAIAKEIVSEKTGFEKMPQDALGVKPAEKE
jgi:hypothetical protein